MAYQHPGEAISAAEQKWRTVKSGFGALALGVTCYGLFLLTNYVNIYLVYNKIEVKPKGGIEWIFVIGLVFNLLGSLCWGTGRIRVGSVPSNPGRSINRVVQWLAAINMTCVSLTLAMTILNFVNNYNAKNFVKMSVILILVLMFLQFCTLIVECIGGFGQLAIAKHIGSNSFRKASKWYLITIVVIVIVFVGLVVSYFMMTAFDFAELVKQQRQGQVQRQQSTGKIREYIFYSFVPLMIISQLVLSLAAINSYLIARQEITKYWIFQRVPAKGSGAENEVKREAAPEFFIADHPNVADRDDAFDRMVDDAEQ
jgi:hypothetical protein